MNMLLKYKNISYLILHSLFIIFCTKAYSLNSSCEFHLSPRTRLFEAQPMNSIDMVKFYTGEEQSWVKRILNGNFRTFGSIKYFNNQEQVKSEVYVKGGLLVDQTNNPVSVVNHIYVVTEDGRLILDKSVPGKIHHSSLAAGQAIICAGVISIHKGKISYLNNQSGHYRPDKLRFSAFTILLKNRGLTLLPNAIPSQYLVDESWLPHLERELIENRM